MLAERTFAITALQPDADRYNADPTTDWFSMENYQEITFYIMEGAGGTGTATITVSNADDNSGTNSADIAFRLREITTLGTQKAWTESAAAGTATTAGANKLVEVTVTSDELTDGKKFVSMTLTEVADSPVDAGVLAILSRPRYAENIGLDPTS